MISLEDKIFNYSKELADIEDYRADYTSQLIINDDAFIKSNHEKIENDEWVYNIVLYREDEIIDSIYCDRVQEEIEDIIIFLIEEYVEI